MHELDVPESGPCGLAARQHSRPVLRPLPPSARLEMMVKQTTMPGSQRSPHCDDLSLCGGALLNRLRTAHKSRSVAEVATCYEKFQPSHGCRVNAHFFGSQRNLSSWIQDGMQSHAHSQP
jgi:hypothetical protein